MSNQFVANWNMPGYLPDAEGAEFETSDEAMEYIRGMAITFLEGDEEVDGDEYEDLCAEVKEWCAAPDGEFGFTFRGLHYFVQRL